MRVVHCGILVASLVVGGHALAADFDASKSECRLSEGASELVNYQSIRALRDEVWTRFEHAAEVSNSNLAINSQSPLYEWANQAKISCAKSYGSLRMRWKWRKRPDHVMLQKCECFYQRMTQYLGQ